MDKNKSKEWFGSAAVLSPDEPETKILPIVLTVLILSVLVAAPIFYWAFPRKDSASVKETVIHEVRVIHDTVVIHDTLRIQQTPITFVCHGICNGIEDFSQD